MVKRRTFFSFHYTRDAWRAATIRNMGVVEEDEPISDNEWETITRGGDAAIQKWIDRQMFGKSCVIVLIGSKTAERKWIKYEIKKAWNDEKGLLGIYIHMLKNANGRTALKGRNPFEDFIVGQRNLSNIVKTFGSGYTNSKNLYSHIRDNLADWVEEAISIRKNH